MMEIAKNKSVSPILKWAGGKRQLLPSITKLIPQNFSTYYEPFIGGAALLFHLQPSKAIINDLNQELINVYQTIKTHPQELIEDLKKHKNESDYFYEIRAIDRLDEFQALSKIEKASRVIFLNKTCFNGLYRVNKSGFFNTPFGRYKNPNIVNEETILAVSEYFNENEILIFNKDYEEVLSNLPKNAFVYFDPPYHPISKSSNFTSYNENGFGEKEQIRLRDICNQLNTQGVKFLLSNSAVDFIEDIYQDYEINFVDAKRAINSNGKKRGIVKEVLIKNY